MSPSSAAGRTRSGYLVFEPGSLRIVGVFVHVLALTVACIYYGTMTGALAAGMALGIHIAAIRVRAFARPWLAGVFASYVLAYASALVLVPPVRSRQEMRRWLPREQVDLCVRSILAQGGLRRGDVVAYWPEVDDPPLTLGIVAATEGQTIVVDRSYYVVDDVALPTPFATSRLVAHSGMDELVLGVAPGQFVVLPTNLSFGPGVLGVREQLAKDLPRLFTVPQRKILGKMRSNARVCTTWFRR